MGSRAKGKKGEEQDFETFVRESLGSLRDDMRTIMRAQEQLVEELSSLKAKVDSNAVKLSDVQNKQESFALKYEKLNGELHENSCKIDKIEKDLKGNTSTIDSLYERLLATERYSRGYNLRFYKVPERQQEDCIDTLASILSNDLNLEPVIENAHRVGPHREDGTARPIIAKFVYRPERHNILRRKKDLKNGVYISEDLIPEDRKRKTELKDVMKQAYESGKKPKFHNGKLYIDGVLHRG